ncbi:MAG: manganese efflux pump MntP family protein [Candidatus Bathyarchaeia archaeon]
MDALTIILIAVGLAMDAFAVSIASGMTIKGNRRRAGLLTAAAFGGFQMLMPVIGWAVGLSLADLISSIDHWIAFGLLAFIGAKMIYEGTKKEEKRKSPTELKMRSLLILAVATSIDALMVGLSFAFLQTSIALPIAVIGAVTFGLSLVGFYFGCGLGKVFGRRIEIVGGGVLILIGLKILLEHLLV